MVLGPRRALHKYAHAYLHMQAYTHTPTCLLSSQWGELVGLDFSSLMETLILAIWKRVRGLTALGILWLAQPDAEKSRKGDRKGEQMEKGGGRRS